MNHQELIKFRQNWSKQEIIHKVSRITKIRLSVRKNCHNIRRNLLLYLFKNCVKTDGNNWRGILLLSATIFSNVCNIILSRLTPYVHEIIGDDQCGFGRNRSITEQLSGKNVNTIRLYMSNLETWRKSRVNQKRSTVCLWN